MLIKKKNPKQSVAKIHLSILFTIDHFNVYQNIKIRIKDQILYFMLLSR